MSDADRGMMRHNCHIEAEQINEFQAGLMHGNTAAQGASVKMSGRATAQVAQASTRVLMLTCQYMPDVYGGAEKQCRRLAGMLERNGVSVTILTSTQSRHNSFDDSGLKVERIYTGAAPDLLGRWSVFSVYWLVRVLAWGYAHRNEFDVIHCHQGKFGGFVATLLGKLMKKPVLIKIGNSEDDMDLLCLKRKFFWGPLCFNFVRAAQPQMIAISSVIERNLRDAGFTNVKKIFNGIDKGIGVEGRDRNNDNGVNLFYHGRVEAIKRLDLLLEAFALLDEPDVKLHIFGDGTALEDIRRRSEKAGLGSTVIFHGATDNVVEEIAGLDVFVNASRAEGFSNSLLEALLLEKVLVSTPVSGAEEAISVGVNGAISRSNAPADIAEAMRTAIHIFKRDPQGARLECRRKIDEMFDMELIAKQYVRLYEELA